MSARLMAASKKGMSAYPGVTLVERIGKALSTMES
jgi:hypothetical protein